jgi:hypothetical protein
MTRHFGELSRGCPSSALPFVALATTKAIRRQTAMMPYQSYQQWAAERTLTLSERRAAERRRGEAAASISGSLRRLRRLRLHVHRPITPPYLASHVPARVRSAAGTCNTEV